VRRFGLLAEAAAQASTQACGNDSFSFKSASETASRMFMFPNGERILSYALSSLQGSFHSIPDDFELQIDNCEMVLTGISQFEIH
jgi:hypothetical protein